MEEPCVKLRTDDYIEECPFIDQHLKVSYVVMLVVTKFRFMNNIICSECLED